MGYLYFNNNENVINEGIKSVTHNILKGGLKIGTLNPFFSRVNFIYNQAKNNNIISNKDEINMFHELDTKFFNSLYSISKKLNDKIFEWCSKTGATLLSNKIVNNKNRIADYKNDFRRKSLDQYQTGLLNKTFNLDSITKRIYDKDHKFFYLVNFIFNDKSIKKLVLLDFKSGTVKYHHLKEWNSIKLEEYKK